MISFWNFKAPSAKQRRGLEDDDDDEDSNRASKSNGGASSLGDCSAVRAFPSKGSTFFIGRRSRGGSFVVGPSDVVLSLGAREERRRPVVVGSVPSACNHVREEERKVLRGARGNPSTTTTTATTSTPTANVETRLPPETLIVQSGVSLQPDGGSTVTLEWNK